MTLRLPKEITGNRVILRKRALIQATQLFTLIDQNRRHLNAWMPWAKNTKTQKDTEEYLTKALQEWDQAQLIDYSLYLKVGDILIGSVGLHTLNWETKTCEVGYWLGKNYEGKGFVSEAVQLLEGLAINCGFHRMYLSCDAQNLKSIAVANRNHYQLEAKQIEASNLNGEFRDNLRYIKLLNPRQEGKITENLPLDCYIRESHHEEFMPLADKYLSQIFDDHSITFRMRDYLSEHEREQLKKLNAGWDYPYKHYFLAFHKEQLIGWTWGYQDSRESFYMVNSAVMPEFRGRGIYKRLLDISLDRLVTKGYQRIWSRHNSTNNPIICAKLKRGFKITAFETSDVFGQLVHLTYFTNELRKNILEFRSGQLRPNEEVKKALQL
ncbi:MAG: GNAT family N-acetyltransferase [Bdellovibrionales bacterium]